MAQDSPYLRAQRGRRGGRRLSSKKLARNPAVKEGVKYDRLYTA